MFGKLLHSVTHFGGASDLSLYLTNLHRTNGSAAPTRDEATKDHAAAMRAASTPWGRL